MKVLFVLFFVVCAALGCSVIGPLPTFDELFAQTEFVITGKIVAGPVYNLVCPESGSPVYALPSNQVPVVDDTNTNSTQELVIQIDTINDFNSTAVVDVSCVHKGSITCATQNGYLVKGPGEVIEEECLVHVHSIDTITSCGYFFQAGSDLKTFLMKGDGQVPSNVPNNQCYDSTYALENFIYSAISTNAVESCPYGTVLPDCPLPYCFNVVADACCDQILFQDEVCPVERLNLSYKYMGLCGDGKKYFERQNSILGQCYCL